MNSLNVFLKNSRNGVLAAILAAGSLAAGNSSAQGVQGEVSEVPPEAKFAIYYDDAMHPVKAESLEIKDASGTRPTNRLILVMPVEGAGSSCSTACQRSLNGVTYCKPNC